MTVIDILFESMRSARNMTSTMSKSNAHSLPTTPSLLSLLASRTTSIRLLSSLRWLPRRKNRAAAVAMCAEVRRLKDEGLDIISEGLDTLKNIALDINEELDKQVPLMDEIDTKVDKATFDLQRTNVRLKKTINEIRSSRNFCIDIILLCVILGIASYLYK
ncbi:hypothetical protein COLO4_05426 [Corchorus olitorius]|uniref:t-SNARE coiled-coil homology domain-containing protein n=1 Tax=Corchorus olitorius TaxID=93759 RepID=A0A1R3KR33_9ROSI|nr:hypothetical protein COLO4_05426 [Corchorus olitorius]